VRCFLLESLAARSSRLLKRLLGSAAPTLNGMRRTIWYLSRRTRPFREAEEASRSSANVSLASCASFTTGAHRDELGRFVFQGFRQSGHGYFPVLLSCPELSWLYAVTFSSSASKSSTSVGMLRLVDARMTWVWGWCTGTQLPVSTPGPVWSIVGCQIDFVVAGVQAFRSKVHIVGVSKFILNDDGIPQFFSSHAL
jgi:hypothetical protein